MYRVIGINTEFVDADAEDNNGWSFQIPPEKSEVNNNLGWSSNEAMTVDEYLKAVEEGREAEPKM